MIVDEIIFSRKQLNLLHEIRRVYGCSENLNVPENNLKLPEQKT